MGAVSAVIIVIPAAVIAFSFKRRKVRGVNYPSALSKPKRSGLSQISADVMGTSHIEMRPLKASGKNRAFQVYMDEGEKHDEAFFSRADSAVPKENNEDRSRSVNLGVQKEEDEDFLRSVNLGVQKEEDEDLLRSVDLGVQKEEGEDCLRSVDLDVQKEEDEDCLRSVDVNVQKEEDEACLRAVNLGVRDDSAERLGTELPSLNISKASSAETIMSTIDSEPSSPTRPPPSSARVNPVWMGSSPGTTWMELQLGASRREPDSNAAETHTPGKADTSKSAFPHSLRNLCDTLPDPMMEDVSTVVSAKTHAHAEVKTGSGDLLDLSEEVKRDTKRTNSTISARKAPYLLPWWFIFVGYAVSGLSIAAGSFFTFMYSLQWGGRTSLDWLLALCFATSTGTLLIEPLKVCRLVVIIIVNMLLLLFTHLCSKHTRV